MSANLPPVENPAFAPLAFSRRFGTRTAQKVLPLAEIKRLVCEAADRPLNRATTLPAQAYTSEEFFEWEVSQVLRAGWQCVAHVSQVPRKGDFHNFELLGEPLIIIRVSDDAVRVLSRVCPHRSMDIMPEGFGYKGHAPCAGPGSGHTRTLLCPYHAWSFDLEGRLKACPEMHLAEGFRREDFFLKPFRAEIWQGFVFVNLDGAALPLADGLAAAANDLAAFNLPCMKLIIAREWDCEFNWKVLVENFMESYHHLGIHHKTLQPMMPARDTWTEKEKPHYVRAHLPRKASVREEIRDLETKGDSWEIMPLIPGLSEEQKSEWGLFLIHPTCLIATAPDRVIWYRLQPLGPDRMKLLTTTLVPPGIVALPHYENLHAHAEKLQVAFHLEDMEVCTAVQRGLYASGWQQGRLSHLEMPVWLFHRHLAARMGRAWPTEASPAADGRQP